MRRRALLAALPAAPLLGLPLASRAQDAWPQKPVRFIVPAAAGGTNDVVARYLQDPLSRLLGQPVIVEYKAGAGGAIASEYVMNQPADGYTLLLHGSGLVTVPLTQRKPSYDSRNFSAVSLVGTSPLVLMAHPSMPATLAGFVQQARANPGKLEWGASALGGVGQLAMEAFHDAAGIQGMVMVPYPGAGPAAQALLGGQTKYMLSTPSSSTNGFVADGRMRILGVSTAQRSPLLPEVPAIAEVVPGYDAQTWFGLVARNGTPPAVIARMADAVAKVVAMPDVQEKIRRVYVVPQAGTRELTAILEKEYRQWSAVVQKYDIRID